MRKQNTYLVWLNWPIGAFRLNARSQAALARLLPAGARLVIARGERAFLRALPEATHAICWNFDKAWFARAPRLRVLATPAAGRDSPRRPPDASSSRPTPSSRPASRA